MSSNTTLTSTTVEIDLSKLTKPVLIAVAKTISNNINPRSTKSSIIEEIIGVSNEENNLLIDIIIIDKDNKLIIEKFEKINIKNNYPLQKLNNNLYFTTDNTNRKHTNYETEIFEIIENFLEGKINNSRNIGIIVIINNKVWYSYTDDEKLIKEILGNNINFCKKKNNII